MLSSYMDTGIKMKGIGGLQLVIVIEEQTKPSSQPEIE